MGSAILKRISLISTVSEIVGYKAGLALSREDIAGYLPEYEEFWQGDDDSYLKVRGEEFSEITDLILYRLGNIPYVGASFAVYDITHKYMREPEKWELFENINTSFISELKMNIGIEKGPVDLIAIADMLIKKYNSPGATQIVLELVDAWILSIHSSPMSLFRQREWTDIQELSDLFHSESLDTDYGLFFDQRFVDFLSQNFDSIDQINWRKFEGLTAEFFARSGFYVEIGEGRNDGGIDVRVWPKEQDIKLPPTILIQCKRQKQTIEKVVVKALWADVIAENAKSGLIVTTSALSPGALKVATARTYPIDQANRDTLRGWINTMRTPNRGVFLGE